MPADRPRLHAHREKSRKKTSRSLANEKPPSNKKSPPRPEGQALRQQTNRVCTHIAKKSQKKTTLQLLVESIKFSTIS